MYERRGGGGAGCGVQLAPRLAVRGRLSSEVLEVRRNEVVKSSHFGAAGGALRRLRRRGVRARRCVAEEAGAAAARARRARGRLGGAGARRRRRRCGAARAQRRRGRVGRCARGARAGAAAAAAARFWPARRDQGEGAPRDAAAPRPPASPALPSPWFFTPAQVLNWFGLLFGLQSAVFLGVIWYIGISLTEQVCSRTGWDEDRKFHDRLGKWWSWANLALGGCSPAIFGQDNLPAEGTGALFVSNHASWFDIPLVAQVRHARGAARHAARPPRARARRQRRAPPRSASLRLSSPRLLPPLILPLHPSRRSPTPTSSWRPTSSARCRSSRSS